MKSRPKGKTRLYTAEEVGQMLRLSRQTVTRLAAAGKLPGFKTVGGAHTCGPWRFREEDIRKILQTPGDPR